MYAHVLLHVRNVDYLRFTCTCIINTNVHVRVRTQLYIIRLSTCIYVHVCCLPVLYAYNDMFEVSWLSGMHMCLLAVA